MISRKFMIKFMFIVWLNGKNPQMFLSLKTFIG